MTPNDSLALGHQSKNYPARFCNRVPKAVVMNRTVTADWPVLMAFPEDCKDLIAKFGEIYPVWVNSHGAVSAIMPNGKQLGLKPDEFDVVEWHEPVLANPS